MADAMMKCERVRHVMQHPLCTQMKHCCRQVMHEIMADNHPLVILRQIPTMHCQPNHMFLLGTEGILKQECISTCTAPADAVEQRVP
jgi:hypothetical protein